MIFAYIIVGVIGGIIGGMGMGGGTLLIPLLTIFCGVEQHIAQSINLIAFVPMSIVAIIIHFKNKLIKGEYFWWIAIPAFVLGVAASLLIRNVGGEVLSKCFGFFLTALGIYQLITAIADAKKAHDDRKKGEKINEKDY